MEVGSLVSKRNEGWSLDPRSYVPSLSYKGRDLAFDDAPERQRIQAEVGVREEVAQTRDSFPVDLGMGVPE